MKKINLYILFILIIFPLISHASTFKLDTSEIIQGKLVEMSNQKIKILTSYGLIEIPTSKFKSMDFTGETIQYIITLHDNSKVNGNLMTLEAEYFTLNTGAGIITVEKKNIASMIEKEYEEKLKEAKKQSEENAQKKEIEEIEMRINQLRLLIGYSSISGYFKNNYKNALTGALIYDRPFFNGILKNLKLGLILQYQELKAKDVSSVKMKVLSGMITARFGYSIASDGFLSRFYPFVRIGGGESLIQLNKQDSSSEAGLNPCFLGGVGLDVILTNRIDFNIEGHYLTIYESSKKLQELSLLGGFTFKF